MRELIYIPDERLRQVSEEINPLDADLDILIDDMRRVKEEHNGFGLAAIQIGVPVRVVLIDDDVLINPYFSPTKNAICEVYLEGCLSIPNQEFWIRRYSEVNVNYYNTQGFSLQRTFDEIRSIAIQHEFDHLNGILLSDGGVECT